MTEHQGDTGLPVHRFAHEAMATEFEILISHEDAAFAEQAADAAFRDIDILETELSRFVPSSDISRLNASSKGERIPIGLAAMDCLLLAQDVSMVTGGAFDITIGPLFKLWRESPDGEVSHVELEAARDSCGYQKIELVVDQHAASKFSDEVQLDLGGVGKGYALDQAAALLKEWDIEAALLHSGTSTVLAIGSAPGESKGWPVNAGPAGSDPVWIEDRALSGSGLEVQGAHIIDPRTGRPAVHEEKPLVWSLAPTAALSDALSTAFMVMTHEEITALCDDQQGIEALFLQ